MSFFEVLVAGALVSGATLVIMRVLEAVAPSASRRHAELEEIWHRAHTLQVGGELDEADEVFATCIEKARDFFGGPTLHEARAWLARAEIQGSRGDHQAMAEAARDAMKAAETLEDGAWFRARSREVLARALAHQEPSAAVEELLDEAESIRIEWDPSSLAEHLEVRASLAAHVDDLERAVARYARLVEAIASLAVVDEGGSYRAPPSSPRERPPPPAYWMERALLELACVAFLGRREDLGVRSLRQLEDRVRAAAPNPEWSRADRLIGHASRMMESGLVEPAAELATIAAGLGSARGDVLAVYAAQLRRSSSQAQSPEAPLVRLGMAVSFDGLETLARLAYERGDHEIGDAFFERAGGELAPKHSAALRLARSSSLYARGQRDAAIERAEASCAGLTSVADRLAWSRWALERGRLDLSERFESGSDPASSVADRLDRAVCRSMLRLYAGDLEGAAAAMEALSLPARDREARALSAHHLGWITFARGRAESARRRLTVAARLGSRVGDVRRALGLYCDLRDAGVDEPPGAERARAIGERILPSRDPMRVRWLHAEARRRLAEGDADAALETAEAMAELDAFWFGETSLEAPRVSALFADVFDALGRRGEALAKSRLALEQLLALVSPDHPWVAKARVELASRAPRGERVALLEPALQTLRAHGADAIEDVQARLAEARAQAPER